MPSKFSFFLFTAILLFTTKTGSVFASPESFARTPTIVLKAGESFSKEIPSSQYAQWRIMSNEIVYDTNYVSEIENINLSNETAPSLLTRLLRTAPHIRLISTAKINPRQLEDFLSSLQKEVHTDPHDARYEISQDGHFSVIDNGRDGIDLDFEQAKAVLTQAFLRTHAGTTPINLPVTIIPSDAASQNIESLGVATLIGEGMTDFSGSPQNRIFNIHRAVEQFHGVLIKKDEEFSFVKKLGEVDGEHGYLPELVIRNNKTQPEFGGGICQVSTTLFRSAIYSGLKITERKNHSYPVRYYRPIGFDATVYVPKPDFKFINNTPANILIQASFDGNKLRFRLYGTDDGRKTTVDGPIITERKENGGLKAEFTQIVLNNIGETLINDTFKSNYDSPTNYPHPGDIITEKPDDWSKKQWSDYKDTHPKP